MMTEITQVPSRLTTRTLPLQTAVLGCGQIARGFHLPQILQHNKLQLRAICDIIPDNLEAAVRQYGLDAIHATGTTTSLYTEPLDLICICTPPASHYALIREALENGCHVVCEKPFMLSDKEANLIAELAQERQCLVKVNHSQLDWPLHRLMERLVKARITGELVSASFSFSVSERYTAVHRAHWNSGDPGLHPLWDLGSHLIPLAIRWFGSLDSIRTLRRSSRSAVIQCSSPEGVPIHIAVQSGGAADFQHEVLTGTHGILQLDIAEGHDAPQLSVDLPGHRILIRNHGEHFHYHTIHKNRPISADQRHAEQELLHDTQRILEEPCAWIDPYTQLLQDMDSGIYPKTALREPLMTVKLLEEAMRT